MVDFNYKSQWEPLICGLEAPQEVVTGVLFKS